MSFWLCLLRKSSKKAPQQFFHTRNTEELNRAFQCLYAVENQNSASSFRMSSDFKRERRETHFLIALILNSLVSVCCSISWAYTAKSSSKFQSQKSILFGVLWKENLVSSFGKLHLRQASTQRKAHYLNSIKTITAPEGNPYLIKSQLSVRAMHEYVRLAATSEDL